MIAVSYSETSHSTALADCPEIKIKKIKATLDPMTKRLQIRITKPIGPIARVASTDGVTFINGDISVNGAAPINGVAAGNVRPRRVHRGKSPVTGGGASRS